MSSPKPRVTVRLAGGLGNQLFMYAAGRRLSIVNDVPLELDVVSGFRRDSYGRAYELERFSITAQLARRFRSYSEPGTGRLRELVQLARRRVGIGPRSWVVDPVSAFDPTILDLRVDRSLYLRGYFQSEQYFIDIVDELRRDLRPVKPLSERSRAIAAHIEAAGESAVGLHGRVLYHLPQINDRNALPSVAPPPRTLDTGLLQERDYHQRAAEVIAEKVGQPQFFVFGDHPHAIAAGLDLPGPTRVVDHNTHDNAVEDLILLTHCSHHIVCGSTMGWWGAWLGEGPGQQVVAPDRGYPNRDLMPSRWRVLPSRQDST